MNEWRELTKRLVELDIAIEELSSWATRPDDLAELERLEALRDDIHASITHHHVPGRLRAELRLGASASNGTAIDPRD